MAAQNCPIGDKYFYQDFTGDAIPAGWVLTPNADLISVVDDRGWGSYKTEPPIAFLRRQWLDHAELAAVEMADIWTMSYVVTQIGLANIGGVYQGHTPILSISRVFADTIWIQIIGYGVVVIPYPGDAPITVTCYKYQAGNPASILVTVNGVPIFDDVVSIELFGTTVWGFSVSGGTDSLATTNKMSIGAFYFIHPDMPNACIGEVAADFTGTPVSGYSPLDVAFTDSSSASGTINQWAWDFGDGNTSTDQNPTHEYDRAGQYTVALTITTTLGATDTETKTNYIAVSGANASYEPEFGKAPLRVNFKDESVIY